MNNKEINKMSKFEIVYCHEKINSGWDAFVDGINGDVRQTSAWANYEFIYQGWRAIRFYVKNEKTIVAGCQISIVNDLLLGNIGLVRRGPCFKIKTPEVINLVVKEIKKNVQILNLSYLMINPDYQEHDLAPFLESEEFGSKFPNIPPYKYSPYYHTSFLDLSLSSDDLLNQMKSDRRKGIRKGLKGPLEVKLGGRDDLKVFYDLYNFTVANHKYTDPITQKTIDWFPSIAPDEVYHIWDELSPRGWIKLFLGIVEGEIICANLVFTFGKIFRTSNWGWNGKYGEYHISDAIHWEMIQWAKTNGFQYYDFCQIDPTIAEAYHSSEPMPEALKAKNFYGPTMFKLRFGGNIITYPGLYVCYSDKMKHLIETSSDELSHLLKLSKDLYWGTKYFFRNHQINFSHK